MTRIILITITLLAMFAMTGCNTWDGAGKDIEDAGESMQGD